MTIYQHLLRKAPYEIRQNLGNWEMPPLGLEQLFKELHEYFLKDYGGPEAYVEKLRESIVEWHSNK